MTDLRIFIGAFFAVIGVTLVAVGILLENRASLETANVNLYCGLAMLAFGAVMLWLARRSRRSG
jgi:putative Ca2+/H+ antiporter (TMEM165/GDT1 family)